MRHRQKITRVYLGIGSNQRDPITQVEKALILIRGLDGVEKLRRSELYRTSPVSTIPQPDFINAACAFNTSLTSRRLLTALQEIERRLGKQEKRRDEPRPIDIDILLFGQELCGDEKLTIPHPRWQQRLFVVAPLSDLTREVVLPGNHRLDIHALRLQLEGDPTQRVHSLIHSQSEV